MNGKIRQKKNKKRTGIGAKDCAYIAVLVALLIAAQLCFSAVPGVELVTVLVLSFSFVFGVKRSVIAATAFSLLRQFVFGVFPTVLVLYLVYYNALACVFGWLGRFVKPTAKGLIWMIMTACVCTVGFTMLDNILTPLWYGYTPRAAQAYFYASLSFMIPHLVCTAVSVGVLFLPLTKMFKWIKRY